jgi:hypothetical protein
VAGTNAAAASSQYLTGGYFCAVFDLRHTEGDALANPGAKQVNLRMTLGQATTETWQVFPTFFVRKEVLISARDSQLVISTK